MSSVPFYSKELFSLQKVGGGICSSNINFGNVTMESDKHIVVLCDGEADARRLVFVDVANPTCVLGGWSFKGDSARMNPVSKILAVKSGKYLQIFDPEREPKKVVKSHVMDAEVIFWKWINAEVVGIVTEASVYHWSLADDLAPSKVFDRHSKLANTQTQIVDYQSDAEAKFLFLLCFKKQEVTKKKKQRVGGSMQLYNTERKRFHPLDLHGAYAGCFILCKMGNNPFPSKLVCGALRKQLRIVEPVDSTPIGNKAYGWKHIDFHYPPGPGSEDDFPVSVQASSEYGLLYLISRRGYMRVFDIQAGISIYAVQISEPKPEYKIFAAIECKRSNGVLAINRDGQVICVGLDETAIIPYVAGKRRSHAEKLKREAEKAKKNQPPASNPNPLGLSMTRMPDPKFVNKPQPKLYRL